MEEKGDFYYDTVYTAGGENKTYHKHYSQTPYIEIWNKALEIITQVKNPNILDIGCGVGQFANLLFDNGISNYTGLDFSTVAINLAKKTNVQYKENFLCEDIYTSNIYKKQYNIVTMLEVLEHIEKDIQILGNIRKGINIIFSVPNFTSGGHVRYFKNKSEIVNRYKNIVHIKQIFQYNIGSINKIYLVDSIKV